MLISQNVFKNQKFLYFSRISNFSLALEVILLTKVDFKKSLVIAHNNHCTEKIQLKLGIKVTTKHDMIYDIVIKFKQNF